MTDQHAPAGDAVEAARYWVTFPDDEGNDLVIQHNADTGQMEIAWLKDNQLVNGFWTMDTTKFVRELRLDTTQHG